MRAFICPNERIMRLLQQTPDDSGVPCHEMVEDVVPKIQFDHRIMNVSYPPFPLGLRFLHLSNVSVNFDQKLAQTSFVLLESLTCRLPFSILDGIKGRSGRFLIYASHSGASNQSRYVGKNLDSFQCVASDCNADIKTHYWNSITILKVPCQRRLPSALQS